MRNLKPAPVMTTKQAFKHLLNKLSGDHEALNALAKKLDISVSTIKSWRFRVNNLGEDGSKGSLEESKMKAVLKAAGYRVEPEKWSVPVAAKKQKAA